MPPRNRYSQPIVREQDLDPVQRAGLERTRQSMVIEQEEADRAAAAAPLQEMSRRIQVAGNIVNLMKGLYDMEHEANVREGAAAAIAGLREIKPSDPDAITKVMKIEEMNPYGAMHPVYQEARKTLHKAAEPWQNKYAEMDADGGREKFIFRDDKGNFTGINYDLHNRTKAQIAARKAGAEIGAMRGAVPYGTAVISDIGPSGDTQHRVQPDNHDEEMNKAMSVLTPDQRKGVRADIDKTAEDSWNKLFTNDPSLTPGEKMFARQIQLAVTDEVETARLKAEHYKGVESQKLKNKATEVMALEKHEVTQLRAKQERIKALIAYKRTLSKVDPKLEAVDAEIERLAAGEEQPTGVPTTQTGASGRGVGLKPSSDGFKPAGQQGSASPTPDWIDKFTRKGP